jgi:hypothetical protein
MAKREPTTEELRRAQLERTTEEPQAAYLERMLGARERSEQPDRD